LSDAQIAAVLLNANQGQVSAATVAVARAQSQSVRDYAQSLVTMHTASQVRENALFADLMLAPQANSVASDLASNSATTVADLQSVAIADFDALYLRTAVVALQNLLDLIDRTLLPMAIQAGLRTELANLRSEVELHHTQARQVADGLDIETDAGVP
jgi:putative membrane protein